MYKSVENPYVKTWKKTLFLFFKMSSFLCSQGHNENGTPPLHKMAQVPPLALPRPGATDIYIAGWAFSASGTFLLSGESPCLSSRDWDSNPSSSFNPDSLPLFCFLVSS